MTATPHLLLLGAGLPQLVVLETLGRRRAGDNPVTLVASERLQAHPGMIPGFIAGRYRAEDIRLDLERACGAAGVRFVEGAIDAIDAVRGSVRLGKGKTLEYVLASIALEDRHVTHDAGPAHYVHGVSSLARALALAEALDALGATPRPEPRRIVIVGASELGVELALAVRARLDQRGATDVIISVLESRSELFGGRLPAWADRVERVLAERDVVLRLGTGATEIGADFVRLSDGRVQPTDLVVAAPGPQPWAPLASSGLPLDSHGFLLLDDTLQVQGFPTHFGAGPGTALVAAPRMALPATAQLRMGTVLARNLIEAQAGAEPAQRFRPRERELTLLDAGDGRAVLLGGPVATVSRWALRYKQRSDRRLVSRLRGHGTEVQEGS